jgi:hypothetical protein
MKRITYFTVRAEEPEQLDELVNVSLSQGFELYGNPYTTGDGWMCQALVKEEASKVGF